MSSAITAAEAKESESQVHAMIVSHAGAVLWGTGVTYPRQSQSDSAAARTSGP
jgi:hypothetical protein